MDKPQPTDLPTKLALLLSTGFGAGFSPIMPGTVGSLWGIPLSWAVYSLPGPVWSAAALGLLAIFGVPLCGRAARALGGTDPGSIVWDEFTSVPFAFFLLDTTYLKNPWVLLAGFLLHRFFDIAKIPPANRCEMLPSGLGIMADDWVAGLYACAGMHALVAFGVFGLP